MPRDDKDFRDAVMVSRMILRKDQEKLEEAIHRAKLLMAAPPEEVQRIFNHAYEVLYAKEVA